VSKRRFSLLPRSGTRFKPALVSLACNGFGSRARVAGTLDSARCNVFWPFVLGHDKKPSCDGIGLSRIFGRGLRMKASEVLRMLLGDGWYFAATKGSYRQFKHHTKLGRVTVPGKPSDDLAPGTFGQYPETVWIEETR
jgi:predicted RNA binding protein YcfA (HicA-like mRNA interferase family)